MLFIYADYDYCVRIRDAVGTAGSKFYINKEGFLVTVQVHEAAARPASRMRPVREAGWPHSAPVAENCTSQAEATWNGLRGWIDPPNGTFCVG